MRSTAHFHFGTKAETLERLTSIATDKFSIPPFLFFSRTAWEAQPEAQIQAILSNFADTRVAVRSSACMEDGEHSTQAGENETRLSVRGDSPAELEQAIKAVFDSYKDPRPEDQVLVQKMVEHITASGVITTYVVDDGSPYYVVSYDDESGKPDAITGGVGVHKTVLVHRDTPDWMMDSPRLRRWISMARDLQEYCQFAALDIEFAEGQDQTPRLLQVRRIATIHRWDNCLEGRIQEIVKNLAEFLRRRWHQPAGVHGSRGLLGEMPDWNPAEIIGSSPRPLASSLYRLLVTDTTWAEARARMGYRNLAPHRLMVMLAGRPFIDVRLSFNSFLPADLPESINEKLVNAWLARLDHSPELHDKVEFQVAQTAYDFDLEEKLASYGPELLSTAEAEVYRKSYLALTRAAITGPTLEWACREAEHLPLQAPLLDPQGDLLATVEQMLQETRTWGTLPFAIAARHAFIAENLLRSAASRGALSWERLAQFKRSHPTITHDLASDWRRVVAGEKERADFMRDYGHLRPGTYDILSLRYDQRPELFSHLVAARPGPTSVEKDLTEFTPTSAELGALTSLLQEAGLELTAETLLDYCGRAIVAREHIKFLFTRHLSNALEVLLLWGESVGLTRERLSFLSIFQLLGLRDDPTLEQPGRIYGEWAQKGQEDLSVARALRIGYLIRNERDIYVAPMHRAAPNFVTSRRIEAPIAVVDAQTPFSQALEGRIVCIENADPGFDWIFTRGISGLVTCFGGANSHMGVRSAELGLPAALGCGEQLFRSLTRSHSIILNCSEKFVRPLDSH